MEDKTVLQLLATTLFVYVTFRLITTNHHRENPVLRSVAVLVLGDVGRSPRMMYHAESFAKNEYETFLIGYRGPHFLSRIPCDTQLNMHRIRLKSNPITALATSYPFRLSLLGP
jgi:beta-1,4-mannosyltransferase